MRSVDAYAALQEMTDRAGSVGEEGLDWRMIVESLPSDPGSIFGVLVGFGAFAVVLYFGLKSSGPDPSLPGVDPSDPSRSETPTGTAQVDAQPGRRARSSP